MKDFLTNPGDKPVPSSQSPRESVADRSVADAAPGGMLPLVQALPGVDVGVGSIGNGAKPYKLGGG